MNPNRLSRWQALSSRIANKLDRLMLKIISRNVIMTAVALLAGLIFGKVIVTVGHSTKMLAGLILALLGSFVLMRLGELKRPMIFGLIMSLGQLLELNPWQEEGAFLAAFKPGFPITLPFLIGFVLCAYQLWEAYTKKSTFDLYPMVTVPFFLIVLWSVLSVTVAIRHDYFFAGLPGLFASFFVYLYGANMCKTEKEIDFVVHCIAAAVFFQGILGVFQNATGNPTPLQFFGAPEALMQYGGTNRAAGTLGHPNTFALFLAMLTPTLIVWIITSRDKIVIITYSIAAGLGTLAMLVANSRGVWAGFALALMMVGFAAVISPPFRKHFRGFEHRILILVGAAVLIVMPILPRMIQRITGDDGGSAQSRVPLANMAKQMIADNPITGVGLGNYRTAVLEYGPNSWYFDEAGFPYAVHNMYLYIIAEIGIPAFGLFLFISACFILQGVRAMYSPIKKRAHLGAALLGGLAAVYLSTKSEDIQIGGHRFIFLCFLGGVVTGVLGGRRAESEVAAQIAAEKRAAQEQADYEHRQKHGKK